MGVLLAGRAEMTSMLIRGVSLFVEVVGEGVPLLLMHGGPGMDHTSMLPLRAAGEDFTLIFYDHRCNGRSEGAEVESMTWENLTADAEALRETMGFDKWAVLGHSFGGMVALEYALRYPQSLSHLILMDTCGDASWARVRAADLLAKRGYSPAAVLAARRFFSGQLAPDEVFANAMKFFQAYYYRLTPLTLLKSLVSGFGAKMRSEAQVFGFSQLLPGWTVMDRLGEIGAPTLVVAGRHDFQFPPEHQAILADRLRHARLEIVERAGHNPQSERPAEVIRAIRDFMLT